MNLNHLQLDLLRQQFSRGGGQLPQSLELITGMPPRDVSIRNGVVATTRYLVRDNLGLGPLTTVQSSVHGDIEGDFLLLMKLKDFQMFSQVMESRFLGYQASPPPGKVSVDWIPEQQAGAQCSRKLRGRVTDALSELGNMFFGSLLVSLCEDSGLATYHDVPRVTVSDQLQTGLNASLSRSAKEGNVVMFKQLGCNLAGMKLNVHVMFLPLVSGVRTLLKSQRTAGTDRAAAMLNTIMSGSRLSDQLLPQ